MITEKEFEELKNDQHLRQATAALVSLFEGLELTPSLDMAAIKEEYKVVLFQKLLKVDKGAKMRYEMHRTEAAKLKMIDELVSLEGYDEINEIDEAIGIYHNAIANSVGYKLADHNLTAERIVATHRGDAVAAAEPYVIRFDVEADENYKNLKQIETIINGMLASGALPPMTHRGPADVIKGLLSHIYGENKVVLNEEKLYYFLKP